jgi:sulfoxide reductase heme-binding subunit YedZ
MSSSRFYTHLALAWVSAGGCVLAYLYRPHAEWSTILTIGLGYVALLLMVVTLAIGPIKLLSRRRNPVNIYLRRDTGIWAGITGSIHVILGLQLHMGGNLLLYFFREDGRPILNLFGQANYTGALATFVLVMLLVTSNDISLKALKGKRWKWLQRANYLLALFVFLHTLLYQDVSRREPLFTYITLGLIVFVLAIQAGGIYLYKTRKSSLQKIASLIFF